MRTAQRLYEGIELPGEGNVGLISYMRTDSVTLAQTAVDGNARDDRRTLRRGERARVAARIQDQGQERPGSARSGTAHFGHLALRSRWKVTSTTISYELYTLIWQRTMACQMVPAVFDTVTLEFAAGPDSEDGHRMRANGSVLVEPGFMAVYKEGKDDAARER